MHDDLMEQVAAEENLRRALAAVKRNHGAAGIDPGDVPGTRAAVA